MYVILNNNIIELVVKYKLRMRQNLSNLKKNGD